MNIPIAATIVPNAAPDAMSGSSWLLFGPNLLSANLSEDYTPTPRCRRTGINRLSLAQVFLATFFLSFLAFVSFFFVAAYASESRMAGKTA